MPIHIRANPGDVAEKAIIVGDPARARQLADLLVNARIVNENRGFITYTGEYEGVDVSIATHGVGAPSAAIVIEELISLGAKTIIRLGTAGALRREIGIGDVIIPTGSAYNYGGIYAQYLGGFISYPAIPDHTVLTVLVQSLVRAGIKPWIGPVYSSDAFYAEEDLVNVMGSRGILAVEMETAILFLLGLIRNVKTGAVLIVSNNLTEGRAGRFLTAGELRDVVLRVGKAVLEAITAIG